MTFSKQKPAIYFPDFQAEAEGAKAVSIFSETSMRETERMLSDTHIKMGGLLGLIVNLNRTHQLGKQLASLEEGLDATVGQQKRQMAIRLEEETKRLQAKVAAEKEKIRMDMERLYYEAGAKMTQFAQTYEEIMKGEALLLDLIRNERETIAQYQTYISELPEEVLHCREYIVYCDVQKKALDQINRYLAELV